MLINPADVAAVADGVLVNAVWAVGRMAARPRSSRRAAGGLETAGWLDTERLTREGLPGARLELPGLTDAEAAELETALNRDEVQGALQALLAARLTDAPETDATRAREAVQLALNSTRYAEQLSEHLDDKISALVATLEGRVGYAGLAQMRAEAYSSRIVAVLGAIERQVAALGDAERGGPAEREWLDRYRRQARARHGFLYPPDFDRRRKVPAMAIYVSTPVIDHIEYVPSTDRPLGRAPDAETVSTVLDLAGRLDRTVLLGDPGGGKTTAANVLANVFAGDAARRIPFLVTLREYAAKTPPERSVAGHIEHNLETLYQSPAPGGLVERLLLTGRAVVIFDGLDELLDTSRRRDVSERVEQFCSAYPLTPVLVTSRLVGYDQARLDDEQFRCYRLGGFGDTEVAEYAGKWFAAQEGFRPAEAEAKAAAFLAESESVPDLRSNPLLLALMCILYRGAGSLPGDRAGIYARCAELLLRRWDEHRDLYRQVRADHLVEPAIRYLAWWLFTRDDSRAEATERELIAKTAEFLYERGYESLEEARAAAGEFVEFSRGRLWVFSDAGTTADGERLYGFTHRTFLEYFAACHLAAVSGTPEDLARTLVERKAWQAGWNVVAELAMKIKSDSSDRAADRIYAVMLDSTLGAGDREDVLELLAGCASAARPSPATMRALTRAALDSLPAAKLNMFDLALFRLFENATYQDLVSDELSTGIAEPAMPADPESRIKRLHLLLEMATFWSVGFWQQWSAEQISRHTAEITALNNESSMLRAASIQAGILSLEEALMLPGGFGALLEISLAMSLRHPWRESYLAEMCGEFTITGPNGKVAADFAVVGRYFSDHPVLPLARCARSRLGLVPELDSLNALRPELGLDELSGLGLTVVLCALCEILGSDRPPAVVFPMPPAFRPLFRDWAEGRVDFVEILDE